MWMWRRRVPAMEDVRFFHQQANCDSNLSMSDPNQHIMRINLRSASNSVEGGDPRRQEGAPGPAF
jgi:hypothetical protein